MQYFIKGEVNFATSIFFFFLVKIFVSFIPALSLPMTTLEAFVDSVDQDQTAQNVQSDLWFTLSAFFILDYNWTVSSSRKGTVF